MMVKSKYVSIKGKENVKIYILLISYLLSRYLGFILYNKWQTP
jgi:hypothetical protein